MLTAPSGWAAGDELRGSDGRRASAGVGGRRAVARRAVAGVGGRWLPRYQASSTTNATAELPSWLSETFQRAFSHTVAAT